VPPKRIVESGPAPAGPYSPAVEADGLIHVSGMLAKGADGTIVARGDVAAQTHAALGHVARILEAAGSSLGQVVSATVYLRSAADFQTMNAAYRTHWPGEPPARTTVMTGLVHPDALVEVTVTAAPAGGERTVVHPAAWRQSPNPYSYAVRSGDTVFLSGLVPRNGRDNRVVTGAIETQTRAVMENAAELLDAAGLSFAHVVSARVYLTEAASFAGMNAVYREYFPAGFPARATVTSGLAGEGYLVEMTFTASSSPRTLIGTPPEGVPISPAVKAGGRLYLSGTLGNRPEYAGDVRAQTRETLARLRATLEAAGRSPADVVDATVYLKDVESFSAMNDEYRAFFGSGFPARTTVGAPLVVDDGLVEIMFTALAP
jgi:reactive intermediate/imine deaminase